MELIGLSSHSNSQFFGQGSKISLFYGIIQGDKLWVSLQLQVPRIRNFLRSWQGHCEFEYDDITDMQPLSTYHHCNQPKPSESTSYRPPAISAPHSPKGKVSSAVRLAVLLLRARLSSAVAVNSTRITGGNSFT